MGYKVDYDVLRSLLYSYSEAISCWSDGMSSVMGKVSSITASPNISGNSAARLKEYLDTAYSCIDSSLTMLLNLFQQNFLLYMDAYSQQADAAANTRIEEDELSELHSDLKARRKKMQQIALKAENALQRVSDIASLPSPDFCEADTAFSSVLTSIDTLDNTVNGLESAHASADFVQIDALIAGLEAHLVELLGQSKEFKTTFSAESYVALTSVPAMLQAADEAYNQALAQKSAVDAAGKRLEAYLALEQAEMEKRQSQMKVFKIMTYAAAAVAVAAFPMASPVVVGMASGLVTSTLSAAADEYVLHGFDVNQWDKGRIGVHACLGTVTGMVGGAVGSDAGHLFKAGIKGLSGSLEGAITTGYDQLSTYGSITDAKAIMVDAAVKGGASFVGSLVGGAIADNTKKIGISSLDLAKDDPLSKLHGVSVLLYEGGKSVGSGIVSRGASSLTKQIIEYSADGTPASIHELDLASVGKDMFSLESIGSDFVVSGVSGAVGDYVEMRTPDPDTGLTPIIQYKLGNTPDPETGTAPIIDEALKGLENKAVWEKTHLTDWHTTDWTNTASSPEEILQLEEMEWDGKLKIPGADQNLAEPEPGAPHLPSTSGVFSGERGNSAFYPNAPAVTEHMRAYGQDYVEYNNGEADFRPFTQQASPWGVLDCQVEIGHMTDQRENPAWEYGRRPTGTSHDPRYDLGNFAQADNALLEKIRKMDPSATMDDVIEFKASSHLTWHERSDGKTMQLVPTDIHDACKHSGGVSEMKYRMAMGNIELPDE